MYPIVYIIAASMMPQLSSNMAVSFWGVVPRHRGGFEGTVPGTGADHEQEDIALGRASRLRVRTSMLSPALRQRYLGWAGVL